MRTTPDDMRTRRPVPFPKQPQGRKAVQITTGMFNNDHVLIALCSDGSMWELQNGTWTQLADIPQSDDEPDLLPPSCATAEPVRKKRFARLREFLNG